MFNVKVFNSLTNKIQFEFCVAPRATLDFLYQKVACKLDQTIVNFNLHYHNKKLEMTPYIYCKEVFQTIIIKLVIYPNLKTNSFWNNEDDSHYLNYLIHLDEQREIEQSIREIEQEIGNYEISFNSHSSDFLDSLNTDMNFMDKINENTTTKNKMNGILSKLKSKIR